MLVTELPGPRARAVIARDEAVTSPSLTRVYPLVVRRGRGCVLEDLDGNRFLDFNAGIAVVAAGHAHPEVNAAIHAQVDDVLHYCSSDFYLPAYADVCDRLAALAPMPDARVFLSNSGTEAVEAALKLARHHTGRPNVIAFLGAFHGRSLGSLSLTASKSRQRAGFGILAPGSFHAPYADPYGGTAPTGAEVHRGGAVRQADGAERRRRDLRRADPGRGRLRRAAAGVAGRPADAVRRARHPARVRRGPVRRRADRADVGERARGRRPRHHVRRQGLASGMPLAGIVARSEVMDWEPGGHGSTFGGNPVACAAALATLELVERELATNAAAVGEHLLGALAGLAAGQPLIEQVRGRGLMIGIDLLDHDTAADVERACFERGLLVLTCGERSIRLAPPLVVTRGQADTAVSIMDDALTAISGGRR